MPFYVYIFLFFIKKQKLDKILQLTLYFHYTSNLDDLKKNFNFIILNKSNFLNKM